METRTYLFPALLVPTIRSTPHSSPFWSSSSSLMEKESLTFVRLSGQPALDTRATNKVVRAHVMRRYKRHQKLGTPQKPSATNISPETDLTPIKNCVSPVVACDCFHPPSCSEGIASQYDQLPSPHCTSLVGLLDPFRCLPIEINERTRMLLQRRKGFSRHQSLAAELTNFQMQRRPSEPQFTQTQVVSTE